MQCSITCSFSSTGRPAQLKSWVSSTDQSHAGSRLGEASSTGKAVLRNRDIDLHFLPLSTRVAPVGDPAMDSGWQVVVMEPEVEPVLLNETLEWIEEGILYIGSDLQSW